MVGMVGGARKQRVGEESNGKPLSQLLPIVISVVAIVVIVVVHIVIILLATVIIVPPIVAASVILPLILGDLELIGGELGSILVRLLLNYLTMQECSS